MKQIAVTLLLFIALAASAFAFEPFPGTGFGPGGTMISDPSASTFLQLPAALAPSNFWQVEMSFTRQYELADLDEYRLAAACRWKQFSFAAGFSQFGKPELYQEQTLTGVLAYRWRNYAVGGSVQAQWLGFGNDYDGLSAATLALSGAGTYKFARFGVTVDNLTEPTFVESSPSLPIQYRGCLELAPNATQTILARIEAEKGRPPQWTFGQRFRLGRAGSALWQFGTRPWTFGSTLELRIMGSRISYGAVFHPELGMTHTIAVGYGRIGVERNEYEH